MIRGGSLRADSLVWTESFGENWKPIAQTEFASLLNAQPSSPPPPNPPMPPQPGRGNKSWKIHIGSTLGMVLGVLTISAGLQKVDVSFINAGITMLVGALAYRSAKKRKMQQVENTVLRRVIEGLSICGLIALISLRDDLMMLIAEDPVPNFVIPAYVLFAYLIVIARKQKQG